MAHQRPSDFPDSEPARQSDDPTLNDSPTGDASAPAAGPDSRPGVLIAVGFLILFVVVLVVAIASGIMG